MTNIQLKFVVFCRLPCLHLENCHRETSFVIIIRYCLHTQLRMVINLKIRLVPDYQWFYRDLSLRTLVTHKIHRNTTRPLSRNILVCPVKNLHSIQNIWRPVTAVVEIPLLGRILVHTALHRLQMKILLMD